MMPGGYPRLSLTGTGLRTMREGDQMPVFLPESGFQNSISQVSGSPGTGNSR
jgi:hypothetical protein